MHPSYLVCNGQYYKTSPVVGSRAHELELIYRNIGIFSKYQSVVYDQQKLNLIPIAHKERADEISKEIYREYLLKYSKFGITIDNSVDWSDGDLTRTYLSDLENEWNEWKVQAIVAKPDNISHINDGMYRPAYICALHELMHVEETPLGILESQARKFKPVIEVLTVTKTLILMDEVYKRTFNISLDVEVDYGNSFNLFGKTISQGALANFYRNLEANHASLAEALVSEESFIFLGQSNIPVTAGFNMTLLNGFIATLGVAAVAIAFVAFGIPGLIVTSIAAAIATVGFFATDVYHNQQQTDNFFCYSQHGCN